LASEPERGLDLIYIRVFQASIADKATADKHNIHYHFLKAVIGSLAVLSSMLSAHALAVLLQLFKHEVSSALFPLHSIIAIPNPSTMPNQTDNEHKKVALPTTPASLSIGCLGMSSISEQHTPTAGAAYGV
jgi:hypothetical protein